MLAPNTRVTELNLQKKIHGYSLAENPALADGRSVKEIESLDGLKEYAKKIWTDEVGNPGQLNPSRRLYTKPDGELRLFKGFTTGYYMYVLKELWNQGRLLDEGRPGRDPGRS